MLQRTPYDVTSKVGNNLEVYPFNELLPSGKKVNWAWLRKEKHEKTR